MRQGRWLNGGPAWCTALLLLWLCPAGVGAAGEETPFGRYHALVIGNDDFAKLPKLQTAVRDAEAVAAVLEQKYGFTIRLLRNASRDEILRALNDYRAELTENDNLLIYYAGHGWLDKQTQTGFWQPVDASPDDDIRWIANDELTRRLKAMSARHVMVVADSCYSGTLVREGGTRLETGGEREVWLRRMAEKRSRTAIVSGGLEPVADQGLHGHSVFANAFLMALRENRQVLDGASLFQSISRPVVVNAEQTPQYSDIREAGHEGGQFIFVPRQAGPRVVSPAGTTTAEQPAPRGADEKGVELTFWESIKASALISDYQAYLEKYPHGEFAQLAQGRIAALREAEAAKTFPQRVEGQWLSQVLINPFDKGIKYQLRFNFTVVGEQLVGTVLEKSMPESSRTFEVEHGILDGKVGEDSVSFRVPYEIVIKDKSGKEIKEKHQKQLTGRLAQDLFEFVMQDDHGFPPEQFNAERVPIKL